MADIAKWRPLKRQDSAGKLSLVAGLVQKLKNSYFEYIAHTTGRACKDNEGLDLIDKVSQHLSTPFTPSTPAECTLEEVRHWAFVSGLAEVSYAADLQHLETDLDGILGPENIEYNIVTAQFDQNTLLKAYYVLALPKLRRLFVVIRGSKEVDDCLEILHAEPLDTLTPTGADSSCNDIAAAAAVLTQDAQLTACIDSLGYDVITIVGHSLGGLTAAAVVQNLREKVKALSNPPRLRGITFGCPAVFSKALSDSLPELISFVHTDDLMPRLSLPALASLFQPAQADPDSTVRPAVLDDEHARDTSLSSSDDDVTLDPSKPVIVPPSADAVTAVAQPSPSESSLSISSTSVASALNTRSSSVGSDDAKLVSSADAFRLPGRVLHLAKLPSSSKGPVYGLFSLSESEALEIKLSPTMLEDHKVKSYVQALRGLEALLDKEPGDQ